MRKTAQKLITNYALFNLSVQKIGIFGPLTSFYDFDFYYKVVGREIPFNFDYSSVHFHAEKNKLWAIFKFG